MTEQDRIRIYAPKVNIGNVGPPHLAEMGSLESKWELPMQRQVKAKSLTVKIT